MQQVASIIPSPPQMRTDTSTHDHGIAVHPVWLSQRLLNPTSKPIKPSMIRTRTDNGEFIPAEPRDGVRRPGQLTQPPGDGE